MFLQELKFQFNVSFFVLNTSAFTVIHSSIGYKDGDSDYITDL